MTRALQLLVLLVPGGFLVAFLVHLRAHRREHAFWTGPNYLEQIGRLQTMEPAIKAARVPKVRALKAEKVVPWAKLRRVR